MTPLEKTTEKKVVEWARANGWLAWKLWGFSQVGLPDRIFIYRFPVVVFIEFKREGKKGRILQERIGKELASRGFSWYIIDNHATAISILKREMGSGGPSEKGPQVAP
jgi:hypothetical protein